MKKIQNLPTLWQEHLEKKIDEINAAREKAGNDAPCFALVTDFHIAENEGYSVKLMEEILSKCDIPYLFSAGDAASGKGICTADFLKGEIEDFLSAFSGIGGKLLFVEGNHERAFSTFEPPLYYKENIPRCELDEICFARQREYSNRVFGGHGYYYVDEPKIKTRFVVLNSQDVPSDDKTPEGYAKYNAMRHFGFLEAQIKWFSDIALRLPDDGWGIVVCSHSDYIGAKKEEHCYNYELMLGVIDAFRHKTVYEGEKLHEDSAFDAKIKVDFEDAKGDFFAWVSGHTHNDRINEVMGVVSVSTTTDAAFLSTNPERRGTLSECAFDVFVVNRKARCINTVRIGAGENREVFY